MGTLLDYSIYQAVMLDGLPRIADYDDGEQRVLYLNGSPLPASMLAADWLVQRGPLPVAPTQQEIDAAIAAREAARQQATADAAALRQQVLTIAQSTVGVPINQVSTVAQLRALMAILLWQAGALDRAGAVRPLAEWVKG